MRWLALVICLLPAACGRPLTPGEARLAREIYGGNLDVGRVRLHEGALVGAVTYQRPTRPRLACRERILPAPESETVAVRSAAMVLFNHVFFSHDWYARDFLPDYPERLNLVDAMLLAHEFTHVWQWQNRGKTGYSPLRAAAEHAQSRDPYLFDIVTRADFLDYGYEQQASIVEEYVCCATLDPEAPRTGRLAAMLRGAFPLERLSIPPHVVLPWKGARTRGICR